MAALRARSTSKAAGGRGCAPALVCSPHRRHALLPTPPSPQITLAPTLPQQSSNTAAKGRNPTQVVLAVSSAAPQVPEVKTESLSNTLRQATITVPAPMVKAMFKKSKDYLEKQVVGQMNGWQAGKPLPLAVVIDQVGGQKNFKAYLIEELLMDTMPKALGSLASAIVPESERILTPAPKLAEMYDPARELTYIVQYEVFPELKWRRPYTEAEVTIQDSGDFSTDAAAVEDLVRQYLKRDGGFKRVVVGRGLQKGDLAIIDMEVRLRDGILPLPGLKKDKMALDTEADPLNLKKGMKGMTPGEVRKFTTTFPKDYPVELWQGLEADVRVKMHELFTWSLPELDDAYVAAHFGDKFKSAEEMRKSLLATTAMLRVQALDKQLEDGVVGAVVSCLEPVDVPDSMVKSNAERQYQQALLAMMQDRVAKPEDIEKLMKPAMLDEYIQRRRPQLEEVCLFNLAVNYIFDQEKLTVDEKDIEEEFKGRLATYKADANTDVDEDSVRMEVTETFRSIAVIEWLKDNVKRNVLPYVPPPADE